MKLKKISGCAAGKSVFKYLIDWRGNSKSKFQTNIKHALFPIWKDHVVFEEFPVFGTRLTLDFFNATKMIAIEAQGGQHGKFIGFFHGKNRGSYLDQLNRDEDKLKFCKINNIQLIEILYEENKMISTNFLRDKLGLEV